MVRTTSKVDDESLANEEQHDCNLSNAEEAPNRSLLHQVGCQPAGKVGAKNEQEDALNNHSLLLVQGKEWGKHAEGMNGSARDDIRGVCKWNTPS